MAYGDLEKLYLFLDFLDLPFSKREGLLTAFSETELFALFGERSHKLSPFLGERLDSLGEAKERFRDFLESLREKGVTAVCRCSPAYPDLLRNVGDPPLALYAVGEISLLTSRCVAVVGRRACRRKSLDYTRNFAEELARAGLTVVSGMADGCDAEAHRGALEVGGNTIAVLAGGFDHVYPQSNLGLFREITEKGLVISEKPPSYRAQRHDFLLRNRIVAGLSEGVLVTCAAERSGTLSTANAALEAGRELFVIPGDPDAEDSAGTNRLIKQLAGALVTEPADILSALGLEPPDESRDSEEIPKVGEPQSLILDVLREEELHINEIAAALGQTYAELAPLLSLMEIQGLIERLPANLYRKKITHTGRKGTK